MNIERTTLIDSRRTPPSGTPIPGGLPPMQIIEVTVHLKREKHIDADVSEVMYGGKPPCRVDLKTKKQCASPASIQKVMTFAQQHSLAVANYNLQRGFVCLSGTVRAMEEAFGTTLGLYQHPNGTVFRGRTGPLTLPRDLEKVVAGVFGLDTRPQTHPHFQVLRDQDHFASQHLAKNNFDPVHLAEFYNMPPGDGSGQTIALIELGGGFKVEDMQHWFAGSNVPEVFAISVDGGTNCPSTLDSADCQVASDIQIISAIAPKAKIVVYFAPNTERGFVDAVSCAVHDTTHNPSIISIGWGAPEGEWTEQAQSVADEIFKTAALFGVTIFTACGDHGSLCCGTPGRAHVDFPSSSPHVISCGGTSLRRVDGASIETVWHDGHCATGGGISETFPKPAYQTTPGIVLPPCVNDGATGGRGVPDVSAVADPCTGHNIVVHGQGVVVGGTATVAALYAGLTARINHKLGSPVGCFLSTLYTHNPMRDVTEGDNNTVGGKLGYKATKGWDPCTGLGTPDGVKMLNILGRATEQARQSGGATKLGAGA